MFQSAALKHKLSKQTYAEQEPKMREKLLRAQLELAEKKSFAVVILVAGIDGAGKGEAIARLYEWMDPHHLHCNAYGEPTEEERQRPPMWRYWRDLPPKSETAIVFGSWYQEPMRDRVFGTIDDNAFERVLGNINRFEEMLTDEGTLVLKFWFALPPDEQKKRLDRLAKKGAGPRHVLAEWTDVKHNRPASQVAETVARLTSTGHAPWFVIPSADEQYRDLTLGQTIAEAIEKRLAAPAMVSAAAPAIVGGITRKTAIDAIDLSANLDEGIYRKEVAAYQDQLALLVDRKAFRKIAVVTAFEGNDAAGKGGSIRRVTKALDPRVFQIYPIVAPTDEEKARPYLWRFWRHIPRKRHIAIFDRSWYGRVLVERVENFCSEADWLRAYNEINAFEAELAEAGIVVVKFWLATSAEEQLRRFKEREETSYKQYKITDEDWRNRLKWDHYAAAAGDMVDRTSTEYAPWTLVAAENKYHARVMVLKTLCERLKAAL